MITRKPLVQLRRLEAEALAELDAARGSTALRAAAARLAQARAAIAAAEAETTAALLEAAARER